MADLQVKDKSQESQAWLLPCRHQCEHLPEVQHG